MHRLRHVFLVALVLGLLVVPAQAPPAGAQTSGPVYLQFLNGAGLAKVRHRGNFFGHVGRGRIVATRNVRFSGCERRHRLSDTLKECRGRDLGFRTPSDERWRLRLRGRRINASGFVRGCLALDGVDRGDLGDFRIEETVRSWPRSLRRYRLGARC